MTAGPGWQAGFTQALFDARQPVPPGLRAWNGSDPQRRFDVYRNNVIVSLVQALADGFPVLRRFVGADFFDAMAGVYVRAQPPTSPVLAHYGDGLADWLERFEPARRLPCLPDLARLEHARICAFHAADAPVLGAEVIAARLARPYALAQARLGLHPSVMVLRSRWAVAALWAAHQHGEDDEVDLSVLDLDVPGATLVLRDPADEVLVIPVDAACADFVQALGEGAALSEALALAPGVDLSAALALLIRHGALSSWPLVEEMP